MVCLVGILLEARNDLDAATALMAGYPANVIDCQWYYSNGIDLTMVLVVQWYY